MHRGIGQNEIDELCHGHGIPAALHAAEHKNGFERRRIHPIGGLRKKRGKLLGRHLLFQGFRIRKQAEQLCLLSHIVVEEAGKALVVKNVIGQEGQKFRDRHRPGAPVGIIHSIHHTQEFGVQADVSAAHRAQHGRKLLRGAGPAQACSVACHSAYAAVCFEPPDQRADPFLIPIFIDQDNRVPLREDVGHRVVADEGIGNPGLRLQKISADEKQDEERGDPVTQLAAEARRPVHWDAQFFFRGF